MDADPAASVRTMKDSSLVRAAEAVRDGKASAMVSAGNTGATMGSALLRMGRIKGVNRPAIATPIPVPGGTPTVLLDAGANAECSPELLRAVRPDGRGLRPRPLRHRPSPGSACCRSARSPPRARRWSRRPTRCWPPRRPRGRRRRRFVGNVEGRDLMTDEVDVVVTDGFTGNVALKTLEGGMRTLVGAIFEAFGSSPEAKAAGDVLLPALLPLYGVRRPRHHGRGHAPRRRRGVHHQPRLLVGHGRSSTPCGWPRSSTRPTSSSACGRRSPPPEPRVTSARSPRPAVRSQAHKPADSGGAASCPPRPTSNKDPWTASRCSS